MIRAILALALAAFAAAAAGTLPWLAVLLALAATPAAFGAVTGRCPIDFVRQRQQRAGNTLGIAEARQPIDIGPKE
ncbi:MAG TPA: hypothetical protein VFY84_20230 [Jiangellales bacterium]|nr:hypothetical protein [Jiangellales bacterium]